MATCRYCSTKFDWGQNAEERWVKLVPIGEDVGMDRTHQDENGVLRAQHVCTGWTPTVKVIKLAQPISAGDIIGQAAVELSSEQTVVTRKRRSRMAVAGEMVVPLKHMRRSKT